MKLSSSTSKPKPQPPSKSASKVKTPKTAKAKSREKPKEVETKRSGDSEEDMTDDAVASTPPTGKGTKRQLGSDGAKNHKKIRMKK